MNAPQDRRPWIALALALTSLVGCATYSGETVAVHVSQGSRDAVVTATEAAKIPQDRYLRIVGTKKSKPGQAAIVVPIDLWGPFRWEAKGGLFDVDYAAKADGAVFGIEVDGRGPFPPTEFYGVASQIAGGGMNVYAYTHASSSILGNHFFATANDVELAIDYDGDTFSFLAREPGDPTFITIATFGSVTQKGAMSPSIGCFNLAKNGAIGFDDIRIAANGTAPGPLAQNVDAAQKIGEATTGAVEAIRLLDGAGPDYMNASIELNDAQAKLATALATVLALPKSKAQKKAKDHLKDAVERLSAAVTLAAAQEKAGKAISHLKAVINHELAASSRIYPIE